MSFCGTIKLARRMKMRSFSWACTGMVNQLMTLKYKREIDKTKAGDQYRLFQLTNEDRDRMKKFAKNLRHFLKEEEGKPHDKTYWEEHYRDVEYYDYEFYVLLQHVKDEDLRTVAAIIDRAADESIPTDDEYKAAEEFLSSLSHRAEYKAEDFDDGCF